MAKLWFKQCSLVILVSSVLLCVNGKAEENSSYQHMRFYQGLSTEEQKVLRHLIGYHRNITLSMAMRAIAALETMHVSTTTATSQTMRSSEMGEQLSYLGHLVRDSIQEAMGNRCSHGEVFIPMLTCCTPRDAYFRQVVTNILTVTGNVSVAGDVVVTGSAIFNTTVRINQPAGQNAIVANPGTAMDPAYSFAGSTSTGLYAPAASQFALSAGGVNKINYNGSSVLVSSIYRAESSSNGQIVPNGATTGMTFLAPIIPSPDFSGLVYRAPVTGIYVLTITLTSQADALPANGSMNIIRNGTPIFAFSIPAAPDGAGGNACNGSVTYLLPLNATDQVNVQFTATGANFTIAPVNTVFSIYLLSVA